MRFHFLPFTRLLLATLIFGVLLSPLTQADSKTDKEKQLRALLLKIDKLKQTIDVKQDSKSRYLKQLKSIEGNIGKVSKKINTTGNKISSKKSELAKLRTTRKKHQQQLSRENDFLAGQVYTAFTLGKQEKMKLLFSQQDAQTMQRNLVYYQYFSNARVDLINAVQDNVDKIIDAEQRIQLAKLDLEKSRQALQGQKAQLDKDRRKRKSIVTSLQQQLKKQGGSLARLEDDATQLQDLIKSIEEIFADAPEAEISRLPFAKLRGKLAWPVQGSVKKLFGRRKPLSDMRWQGIMIEAPNGRHVKAVSHGRVAFSDWLRGLGNLIIIDHGNSYLSLYGHNESLFKAAGEWVESGDIIGSIGSSGGQRKAGLYFEIRKKGKPQNPTRWCKKSNQFAS
jgi:septal ring factor EnvC (AmiA/AmiB activator)